MTLNRKDTGDTEEQDRFNKFINQAYRELWKIDLIPATTTLTLDSNGQATLPTDFYKFNVVKDSNGNQIFFRRVGNTITGTYKNGCVVIDTITFDYFKQGSDLTQDTDEPEIQEINHSTIAIGASMYYALMKDDTIYNQFKGELEQRKREIQPISKGLQFTAAPYNEG